MKLKVTFDGVEKELPKSGLSDLVAFEKKFDKPARAIQEEGRLEYMAYLVYRALRKAGAVTKDVEFDEDFIDRIEDVDVIEEDEENPTQAAPPAA